MPCVLEVGEVLVAVDMVSLIGRCDRIISEMMIASTKLNMMDDADRQTLKHHADDMRLAGEAILQKIRTGSFPYSGDSPCNS